MKIHTPPNERVIDEVWIGLSEDADGKNGIVATYAPRIGGMPMMTGSPKVLEVFKLQLDDLAVQTGKRIKIYRFTRAEEVMESWGG